MAIIVERQNVNKPPTPAPAPGKLAPGQINNNKDLDVDPKKEDAGFFGSFFSSSKGAQGKKKGAAAGGTTGVMEAVSGNEFLIVKYRVDGVVGQPPAVIKPQTTLTDKETMEIEVISTFTFAGPLSMVNDEHTQSFLSIPTLISSNAR
jgi:vacuolar protein sorting-associated protein 1